ncbi:titin [Neocloeon triangulifer]|uniref:titin n=1 Tax=Neocloeon triangulifer TaxID=2078957 RepID=UPI00286F06AD|nr:titin [Neocloeon triangulifer]
MDLEFLEIHPNNRPTANLHDILTDPTIPEWKKDLIVRKRNTNRILFGNLKLQACAPLGSISNHNTPTADAIRNDDVEAATAADANWTEAPDCCESTSSDTEKSKSSSPVPGFDSTAGRVKKEEAKDCVKEKEEADFHLQEEEDPASSSPQVNGESDGVGTVRDQDAVDSLFSGSAPVSAECRSWCEGAMRLNNDLDRFPGAEKKPIPVKKLAGTNHKQVRVHTSSNKIIMGEEKPKMKSSVRKLSAPPHGTKPAMHTVNLGDPEEIKYGPGIVHKLRDRYINITLRESASAYKQRQPLSNLRRASSLDNILDEAPVVRRPPPEKKQPAKEISLSVAENIKRHRSMETLLFEKQTPLINDDIVIIEHSLPVETTPSRKRNSSGGEDELPPPDVVKQTRQKFERRTNSLPQPNKNLPPSRVVNAKKPALSPKPANLEIRKTVVDLPSVPLLEIRVSEEKKLPPPVIVSEEPKPVPRVELKDLPPLTPKKEPSPPLSPVKEPSPPPRVMKEKVKEKIITDDDDETTKMISKKALENIRKNGFSFVISPKGSPNLSHLPGATTEKSTLPPQVISVHQKVPDKQVGVIRPIPKVDTRVNEKNLINAVKSEQPHIKAVPVVRPAKVETVPVVVSKDPGATTELWGSKKRHFNEQPSTQCFDFTTRKSVPDYIENDGLGQRPAPVGEEVDSGNLLAIEINFEIVGGNVVINGRSSLQKRPKENKMRIKFDDGATSTFEYPSEASLLMDDGVPITSPSAEDTPAQPRGLQPLPSGSGSLASYTPSKILMSDDTFELGVTRAAAMTPILQPSQPQEDSFLLKPADDEETVAWSSESASSDLLF